jgi:hypothetical protein
VFDHSPIVIYGVFKVLLSRDFPKFLLPWPLMLPQLMFRDLFIFLLF